MYVYLIVFWANVSSLQYTAGTVSSVCWFKFLIFV